MERARNFLAFMHEVASKQGPDEHIQSRIDTQYWLIEQAEQIHEFNNMLKEIGHALDDYENTGTWSEEDTLKRIAGVFKGAKIN